MNVGGNIEEPAKCPESSCGQTWTMQLMHNYSEYNDKQLIKMQVCTCRLCSDSQLSTWHFVHAFGQQYSKLCVV